MKKSNKPYFAAMDKLIYDKSQGGPIPKTRLVFYSKTLKQVIKNSSDLLIQRLKEKARKGDDDLTFFINQFTLMKVEDVTGAYFKVVKVYKDEIYQKKLLKLMALV